MIRSFILVAGLTVFLFTSFDALAKRKAKKQYFNQTELAIPFDPTHPILTANFLAGEHQELLVMGQNKNGQKLVTVLVFNQQSKEYVALEPIVLPDNAVAFDLLTNKNGIDELLLLSAQGLSTLNFEARLTKPLASIQSIYLNSSPQFIAPKKLVKDINGDQLDDIVVTNFSNQTIFVQKLSGEFEKVSLPIKATVDMSQNDISFSEPRVFNIDTNFDQRTDLVTFKDNQMVSYEQTQDGLFSSIPNTISLPNEISALPWWSIRGADGESVDQSQLEHRMVETIEDINGDGISDLMVKQTQSSGVLDRQNNYEIYYGKNQQGILYFNSEVDTRISAEGTLSGLQIIDVNDDGRKEIMVSSFDIGVSQIIGALMSGSIDQDVYLFTLDEKDKFNAEPLFSEEVDLNFSLSSGRSGQPVILSADLNGDGLNEMLLSANEERLAIYTGKADEEMFESRAKRHRLQLPKDGSMLSASDLNNDQSDEIIVRYGKQDDEKDRRKIIILTAKVSAN
ncbi:MAG: VCBS repeat-containing protein [Kangiellaceae bacterium]|jgi:mRNA-degrading endonuclease HigB of HigAB toxin-antitoxin module